MKKRKLFRILSISALFAVVCVVGVVGVFASYSTANGIRVLSKFSVDDVVCSVQGKTYFGNNTGLRMTGGSYGTILFGENSSNSATLTSSTTQSFSDTRRYIVYEYIFSNFEDCPAYQISLTYTDTTTSPYATDSNVLFYYHTAPNCSQVLNPYTNITPANATQTSSSGQIFSGVTVQPEEVKYVYIIVGINVIYLDSELSGVFNWAVASVNS